MFEKIIMPVLIMLAGLFSAFCALKEYEWFMHHRKAETMAKLIGYTGTRIFYITLGAALFVVGAVLLAHGLGAA